MQSVLWSVLNIEFREHLSRIDVAVSSTNQILAGLTTRSKLLLLGALLRKNKNQNV